MSLLFSTTKDITKGQVGTNRDQRTADNFNDLNDWGCFHCSQDKQNLHKLLLVLGLNGGEQNTFKD